MIKAFLSHSSSDKDHYVGQIARALGKDNIVYDEFTFEMGELTLQEILKGLDATSLFVIFLSGKALDSEWVKREIIEAENRLNEEQIKKCYPIIIDKELKYSDERIPDWLRQNYNLKPILRPSVTARRIQNKLRELSWGKHPLIKQRQTLFVGRNDNLEEFEERIHDFDKIKPTLIVASGMPGVGRRTFLHRALHKVSISELSQKPSAIYLDRNVSIEDFIYKLNDLGLSDLGDDLIGLNDRSVQEKIQIVHKIMKCAYEAEEIIYILDDGCLVNYKRELSGWFVDTIESYNEASFPIFCIAARFKVWFGSRPKSNKYYFVELNELNPKERTRLLANLVELYNIELSSQDFSDVAALLFGLPEQVGYAADLIREDNVTSFIEKLPLLQQYNSDKAATLLSKHSDDEEVMEFIRLLAQFELISKDYIFKIVPYEPFYEVLESLASENICEFIGADGEIIRLSDVIRDYVKRNRLQLRTEYSSSIRALVQEYAQDDDVFQRDSSEFIFTMKEALSSNIPVNEKLLIPSHYLRCMKDLYYERKHNDRIVQLADIVLQKKENMDAGVVQDIQYYLCLALAKKKDKRVLGEVQKINGPEHTFLLGFYYRQCRNSDKAKEQFEKIVDAPFVGSRARRELVQVYVMLEEYDKALDYARENYEHNRGNQFHTQAYFQCLIHSEDAIKSKSKLHSLISELKVINSVQSLEMADIGESLIEFRINGNKEAAISLIHDSIGRNWKSIYPILALCDMGVMCKDADQLGKGLDLLHEYQSEHGMKSGTAIRFKAALLALQGDKQAAFSIVEKNKRDLSPRSIAKLNLLIEDI